MTISQKMYIFYKRYFGVRKPHTDKFYYPKLLLYKVLKFLGSGRIKASATASTVNVGTFTIKVDQHDSLNLIVNPKPDPDELAIVTSMLKPGDTAIDIGANIGLYTLHMAGSVGSLGKVFAFEPEPENFALLKLNVASNKFGNVTLYQCAASNARSTARLSINNENMGMHRLSPHPGSTDSIVVETVRVDDLIDSRTDVRLAKIDVEGHELPVLEGMTNLLSRNTGIHLLVEYNPSSLIASGAKPGQLLDRLNAFGFVMEIAGRLGQVSPQDLLENFPIDSPAYANLHCYRP